MSDVTDAIRQIHVAMERPGSGFTAIGVAALVAPLLVGASSCGGAGGSPAFPTGGGGGEPAQPLEAPRTLPAYGAPPPRTSPALVPIGTAMRATDGKQMTVAALVLAPASGNMFEVPAAGKQCIQITLALTNASDKEWAIPTYELGAVDANGQKYESNAINCGPGDDVHSLVAGGHVVTRVRFEVPKGSPLNLSWVPNPFESEVYQTKLR